MLTLGRSLHSFKPSRSYASNRGTGVIVTQNSVPSALCHPQSLHGFQKLLTKNPNKVALKITFDVYKIKDHKRYYCSKNYKKVGKEVKATGGHYQLDNPRDPIMDKLRACRSIRGRKESAEFLIEERTWILQALEAKVQLTHLVIKESSYQQQQAEEQNQVGWNAFDQEVNPVFGTIPMADYGQGEVPIVIIKDHLMEKLYPIDTPHMVAVAKKLHSNYQSLNSFSKFKRILVLDNVLNPRNIGMILRSAEAFDVDGVVLLTGPNATELGTSEDLLYSRLSISASRGAAFRLPFIHVKKSELLDFVTQRNYELICTSPHDENSDIPEWQPPKKKSKKSTKKGKTTKSSSESSEEAESEKAVTYAGQVLVVGNETYGVRPEIIQHATSLMTIPTSVESLNAAVACGIILFKLANKDIIQRKGEAKPFVSKVKL